MLQFNSLAIGLAAVLSISPVAGAFTPIGTTTTDAPQPAANLHAQVRVNVDIGIGSPPSRQPQRVIYVESRPQQNVIVVERDRHSEPEDYRGNSRWAESRGRHQGFSKHGRSHGRGHSKHHEDRDD
jgi:hypothetical protein